MNITSRRIDYTEEYVIARLSDNGEEMEVNNIVLNLLKNIGTGYIMAGLFDLIVFDHQGIDVDESANYPVDSTHAGGMRYVPVEAVMSFYGHNPNNTPYRMVCTELLGIPSLPESQSAPNSNSTWRDIFSSRVKLMVDHLYQVYYSTNLNSGMFQMQQPETIHHPLYVKDLVLSILLKLINTILSEVFFTMTSDGSTGSMNVLFEMEEHSGKLLSFTNVEYNPIGMGDAIANIWYNTMLN